MEVFINQLDMRLKRFILASIGIKQFWGFLATVLLCYKIITPEIWLALLAWVLGIRSFEKVKNVGYNPEGGQQS